MNVVFDTNVLIAAFLTEGVCSKLLVRARRGDFDLFLSKDIIQELERNLRKKFSLSASEINDTQSVLTEAAKETFQQITPITPICRDPEDDQILACARQAEAEYLVTGDQDLLVLERYGRIKIINPRDFENIFED
jgi:uncharacterized protein